MINENYEQLFKILGFEEKRNDIFEEFHKDIENFIKENNYKDLNDIKSKFSKYKSFKKSKTVYSDFIFDIHGNIFYFFHKDYKRNIFNITGLKKFSFYKKSDGSIAKKELVFN